MVAIGDILTLDTHLEEESVAIVTGISNFGDDFEVQSPGAVVTARKQLEYQKELLFIFQDECWASIGNSYLVSKLLRGKEVIHESR